MPLRYNVGQVAVGIGDVSLAYQAFKIATSVDSAHAESFNCIGVLELRKQDVEAAQANFATAQKLAPYLFEPFYNSALLAYKMGNFQDAFLQVSSALEVYPGHSDSLELKRTLSNIFSVL